MIGKVTYGCRLCSASEQEVKTFLDSNAQFEDFFAVLLCKLYRIADIFFDGFDLLLLGFCFLLLMVTAATQSVSLAGEAAGSLQASRWLRTGISIRHIE